MRVLLRVSNLRYIKETLESNSAPLTVSVIGKYQYRGVEVGKTKTADNMDFKRLNKIVLKEGATNAAVSR